MDTYKAGSEFAQIMLSANINTIGLAGSRATLFVPGSGYPSIAVAHSVDATGDIPVSPIGISNTLTGKRISIMSKIDLSIIGDLEARQKEFNHLSVSYFLEGGSELSKEFSADTDDLTHAENYMTALIYKAIDII